MATSKKKDKYIYIYLKSKQTLSVKVNLGRTQTCTHGMKLLDLPSYLTENVSAQLLGTGTGKQQSMFADVSTYHLDVGSLSEQKQQQMKLPDVVLVIH